MDLDRISRRGLGEVRRTLVDIASDGLDVRGAWLYPSSSGGHYHLIVQLLYALPTSDRVAFSLLLGNDRRRAARSLLRLSLWGSDNHKRPCSLLISPMPYPGFYREPDFTCDCTGGHKTTEQMKCCPVGYVLGRQVDPVGSEGESELWTSYGRVL